MISGKRQIIFVSLSTIAVVAVLFGVVLAGRAYENLQTHKEAGKAHLASIQLRTQVDIIQYTVECWAKTNTDHRYPASVDDINDVGQTMVDLLPGHHRLLNAYHECSFAKHQPKCFSEPRNWAIHLANSDSVLTAPDGAIYYWPKPDGHGYFIRAYNKAGEQPLILSNR